MQIDPIVQALLPDCIALRQALHRIPEPGFEEYKTAELIRSELLKYAPDRMDIIAGTGTKAVWYASPPAPPLTRG